MRHYYAKRPLVALGVALLVVGAANAADVNHNFEEDALGSKPEGWSGYCAVSNNVGSYSLATPGAPMPSATHTNMLSLEGSAKCEYTASESGDRVIELLVMADDLPDEELPSASGDEQTKFAFDTNGCINLYHKLTSSSPSAQWTKLSDTVYSGGTWVRVSFTFDYAAYLCMIKVDGSPLASNYGYRQADSDAQPGPWYCLATNAEKLASIDFVGCGAVDDVVNYASANYTPSTGATTATNGVDYAWFDKNGMAWCDPTVTDVPGGSGYKIKEAFDTGVDPYSANKLYVTNATYTTSQLVLTFNGYGKTYRVVTSASPFTDGTAGTDAGGTFTSNEVANTTTWTGAFPDAALTYYRVRNTSLATAETINQFAIQKITSTATNTMIALPWKSLSPSATSPSAITAANVVMTNNLVDGDWLLYYDSAAGKYKGWRFNGSAWVATANASVNGMDVVAAASDVTLERGQAIWLVRTPTEGRGLAQPFYLYGQYLSTSGSTSVPAGGTLLASPSTTSDFVVSASSITGGNTGDEIRVPQGDGFPKVIKKFSDGWKAEKITVSNITGPDGNPTTTSTKEWSSDTSDLTIPTGQGFMYIRTGETQPTVNW